MKSKHITKILDKATFAELSEADKTVIAAHTAGCADCGRAFEAARLSEVLLKVEADAEVPAPSAFFHAKVMNAWRERQLPRRPVEAFRRWWQASAAPVFMMLVMLGALISLTLLAPQSSADDSAAADISDFRLYTTENVVLNQKPSRDLTNEQVFQVIYSPRSDLRK